MSENINIAIIGGGPVGLFLAICLKKKGYSVEVMDKSTWPIDKVCGQGLMPSGVKLLKKIGIHEVDDIGFTFNQIQFLYKEYQYTGLLPGFGRGIKRKELSRLLYQYGLDLGVKYSASTLVKKLELSSHQVMINDCNIAYDYVFACDGLNSNVRKLLNKQIPRLIDNRMGARVHLKQKPWFDGVQVFWGEGVEAYVTPVNGEEVELAFLWYQDVIAERKDLLNVLIDHFPSLKEKINISALSQDFKGYGPFKSYSSTIKYKNIFFAGDAYKFLDGITGEGLSIGFKMAYKLSNSFHSFRWYHALDIWFIYAKYTLVTNLALILSRWAIGRNIFFKRVINKKWLFNFFLRLNDW